MSDVKPTQAIDETTSADDGRARRNFLKAAAATATGVAMSVGLAGKAEAQAGGGSGHVRIVFAEGQITLAEVHAALDEVVQYVERITGGCNCGLTGFDISFLRSETSQIQYVAVPNVQAIFVAKE